MFLQQSITWDFKCVQSITKASKVTQWLTHISNSELVSDLHLGDWQTKASGHSATSKSINAYKKCQSDKRRSYRGISRHPLDIFSDPHPQTHTRESLHWKSNHSHRSQRHKPSSQQNLRIFLNAGGWHDITKLMMDGTSEMSIMNKQVYGLENPEISHHKVHWVKRISAQLVHSFHLSYNELQQRLQSNSCSLQRNCKKETFIPDRVDKWKMSLQFMSIWFIYLFLSDFAFLQVLHRKHFISIIFKQKVLIQLYSGNCHLSFACI